MGAPRIRNIRSPIFVYSIAWAVFGVLWRVMGAVGALIMEGEEVRIDEKSQKRYVGFETQDVLQIG